MKSRALLLVLPMLVLLSGTASHGQLGLPRTIVSGVLDIQVTATGVSANLRLPLGIQADLGVEFDQVVGLTANSLGLDVSLASLRLGGLLNRLPELGSLQAAFPLLLSVQPKLSSPLSFTGTYEINLHTKNLHYTAGTPLRLFKAENGGDFYDITDNVGQGSYRVRGTSGGFSEFIIIADLRPSDVVIESKYGRVRSYLDSHLDLVDPVVADQLYDHLDASELSGYEAGDRALAIGELESFLALVEANAGDGIPNVWRASRDLENVAGELIARARTTRFSLLIAP